MEGGILSKWSCFPRPSPPFFTVSDFKFPPFSQMAPDAITRAKLAGTWSANARASFYSEWLGANGGFRVEASHELT